MKKNVIRHQQDVLKELAGRIDDFYLAGGTALALFYFQHRLSVDLDFFTRDFNYRRVAEIARYLEGALEKKVDTLAQNLDGKTARMAVYSVHFSAHDALKIDFVEDTVDLLKKTR